jgi:hypothetical protein
MAPTTRAMLSTVAFVAAFLSFPVLAQQTQKSATKETSPLDGYWRLLQTDADKTYVAAQGQCFQEIVLPEGIVRAIVSHCPVGETRALVVGAKNFYWSQELPAGARPGSRSKAKLFTCRKDRCTPHALGSKGGLLLDGFVYRDGKIYAAFSRPGIPWKNPSAGTLIEFDEESEAPRTVIERTASIRSFTVDATDLYYYPDDGSDVIWRRPVTDRGKPEIVVRGAGNSQRLLARTHEEMFEIDRQVSLGRPEIRDFYSIIATDGDRLYWKTTLLHWYSKRLHEVGFVPDDEGKPLSVVGYLTPTSRYFYFTDDRLSFISRVLKAGGRPERLVANQKRISGILPSPKKLVWSIYSPDLKTTTIRWIDLSPEE